MADSDGDGMANRLEYPFGSNPLLAGDAPQPLVSLLPGLPGGAPLRLSLTSRQLATRSSVETISAEFTSDLIHWTSGTLLSTTPQPDGSILQVWGDRESSPGGTQRLGRLKETPVP